MMGSPGEGKQKRRPHATGLKSEGAPAWGGPGARKGINQP
jgi:hypothetical protein